MKKTKSKPKPVEKSTNTVYVIHRQCFDDFEVMGVYRSKKHAQKLIRKWIKEFPEGVSYYYILEFEVQDDV